MTDIVEKVEYEVE